MKVLFFIPTLGAGGAERTLVQIVNNIDLSKFQVTVQSLFDYGELKTLLNKNIKYKYVFRKLFKGNVHLLKLFSPRVLYKYMIRERYDVIVSFLEGPTTRIISGCNDSETKMISWIHTSATNPKIFLHSYRSRREFIKCMNTYNQVVFVAESAKNSFGNTFPELDDTNEMVCYNPINSKNIIYESEKKSEIIFEEKEFNIVSTGRLETVKGFERLIKIVIDLQMKTTKKIHLYIIGKGTEYEKLNELIKKNNATEYISLLGFKRNPYTILKQADLYVCSSFREGYSTAVIEALILGIPVVTSECSGMREILGDSRYGVITLNTDEALSAGIKEMVDNDIMCAEYREKAHERGEFYNLDNAIQKVEKILLN